MAYNIFLIRQFTAAVGLLFLTTVLLTAQTKDTFVEGAIYFKVSPDADLDLFPYEYDIPELNQLIDSYQVDTMYPAFPVSGNPELQLIFRMEFSNPDSKNDVVEEVNGFNFTDFAEGIPLYHNSFLPNDIHADQWYLDAIDAAGAWQLSTGSKEIALAVVDNAVFIDHEDLDGNVWENPNPGTLSNDGYYSDDYHGYDVADRNNDPTPPSGIDEESPFSHGSHVAGIASAVSDNGIGIASIGYNTSIMAVKASRDNSSGGSLSHAYEGVNYAAEAGADIINMSFGASSSSITGSLIIQDAYDKGIVLIGAAGNMDVESVQYPAAYSEVIAVAATNQDDQKAWFSSYGDEVDISAPGQGILSTLAYEKDAYGHLGGTSMSAPLVSGTVALMLAVNPELTPEEVREHLKAGADPIDANNPDYAGKLGAGRLNAANSLQQAVNLSDHDVADHFTEVNLYPNPATDVVNLAFSEISADYPGLWTYKLTDLQGRIYQEGQTHGELDYELNTEDLSPGIYVLQLLHADSAINSQHRVVIR